MGEKDNYCVWNMLERCLIEHCSPTLACLKTANLFNLSFPAEDILIKQLAAWNRTLEPKGVSVLVLRRQKNSALVYVYRKARLQKDLEKPGVSRFLTAYGYQNTKMDQAINRLRSRLAESDSFPHEIGIFLGYPLGDVVGFIQNAGRNSKCTGCWKVYCNECEAIKYFAKFRKCKDVYWRLWNQGKSVWQLTVAA